MKIEQEESEQTSSLLAGCGAVLTGHFVGVSRKHLNLYVAKDRGTRISSVASSLCAMLARRFADEGIDAVVSPAVGGVALSHWGGHHLTRLRPDRPEVLSLYCEHEQQVIAACGEGSRPVRITTSLTDVGDNGVLLLLPGQTLVVMRQGFVLNRGFAADVKGRRVAVFEDVFTTGLSAHGSIAAVRQAGGEVVGVGVLVNGGGITAEDLGVPRIEALLNVTRRVLTEEECAAPGGMCADGVPVNTEFGHGKQFLVSKGIRS
ncbi:MAG: hypothetical protein WC817_00435 [Patescibacteria group bacterium]|jgi:orotate phosphoribosyltransferase